MRGEPQAGVFIPQLKLSTVLLMLLAQFSDCAGALFPERAFEARRLPISIRAVEEVASLGEDDFVVTSIVHPTAMAVARVRGGQEESVASTPALFPYDLSSSVIATERAWWFSRYGVEGMIASVFFVVSDGAIRETRVNVPRYDRALWLPVRGAEPRGMFVAVDEEQHALVVTEVTPAGSKPRGAFPWPEEGAMRTLENDRWSAEPLGDGRVAIVGIDAAGETLMLRIVGEGEPVESPIPCASGMVTPFHTAVDASGRLAVAGLSQKRAVIAILLDADRPQDARCRVISAPDEVAARQGFGTPSVVWTGEHFVAGWIREDGTVRASQLGNLRAPPPVIDVAEGADVDRPLRRLVYSENEYVTFVWNDRGGDVVQRRLPATLNGYAFLSELRELSLVRRLGPL